MQRLCIRSYGVPTGVCYDVRSQGFGVFLFLAYKVEQKRLNHPSPSLLSISLTTCRYKAPNFVSNPASQVFAPPLPVIHFPPPPERSRDRVKTNRRLQHLELGASKKEMKRWLVPTLPLQFVDG